MEKQQLTLAYYERSALKQSALLIESAEKSYQSGEIDYFEYILSLGEAFTLQLEYLGELLSFNQTVIDIDNLIGD
jgi:cobalt-zinc-cadmium resistance protein CzcA